MPYADSDYERSWKMHTTGVTLRPLKPECPTPGPWYCHVQTAVAEESDGEYGAATCITTADAGSYSRTGNRGDVIAWVPHDRKHGPNARLIAAAPEMLATLKSIADECERRLRKGEDSGDRMTLRLCRSAIDKAEGRSE